MTAHVWNRVTVIGCGLIGGSFALALKRCGACERISGWDMSARSLDEALKSGAIDAVDVSFINCQTSPADLIYLAMPVKEIISFFHEYSPLVKPGAILTDAGSTKAEICRAARAHLSADRHFIGGHPIAGSHRAGIQHARAELFEDAPYVLINEERQSVDALSAIQELLRQMGARVCLMEADKHDRAMAFVSHLPQLISSALAATVKDQPDAKELERLSGAGYRDMTRLAGSLWSIWRDILETNHLNIADALDMFIKELLNVRNELREQKESSAFTKTGKLFDRSSHARIE